VALAPFFERVFGAVAGHVPVSRESLTALLENVSVGVSCGSEPRKNDLWTAEFSTNILARLYPRLAILGPERYCSVLRTLALKINPQIEFATHATGSTTLCVGSATADGALYPNATGWVARVDHLHSHRVGPQNPYAAAAAGALACAELFRRIFLRRDAERDMSVSLLDYKKETGANLELTGKSLGDVLFVGVGAVGNAAIWGLSRHENIRGRLWLVDPEILTLLNLQRYVLGGFGDVDRSKVELGHEALRDTSLTIEVSQNTLEEFAQIRGRLKIPTICISVDNVEARRSAQALLPKLVINGWTGDQALGSSWHVFSREAACLACLYQPRGPGPSATEQAARALGLSNERATLLWVTRQPLSEDDFRAAAGALGVEMQALEPWHGKPLGELYTDVVCGAVPLELSGLGRIETVPLAHQSALAGILMIAELVKRTDSKLASLSQTEPLVSWDDILRPPPAVWRKPRARERGCICGDADYQRVYRAKWKKRGQSRSPV
jgi:hypothetical protein